MDNIIFKRVSCGKSIDKKEENPDIKDNLVDDFLYLKIKVKNYRMNGDENCLIQMVDETKNVMF